MKKIVAFGELMLRLSPKGYLRFAQADSFEATYGGAEANVAVSLSYFGMYTKFVTKLPKHEIGQAAVNSLRRYGVDTSGIARGGERMGLYYLEKGASQRPSKVIYDRAYSAISQAMPEDFDWNEIFEGAVWFHLTGITPALGPNVARICIEACKKAKEKGITVSFDMNYRKNLWTREEAKAVIAKITPYIDVCIANEEDAEKIFDIKADSTYLKDEKLSLDGYRQVSQKMIEKYGFKMLASTFRESISASDNIWSAMLYDGKEFYFSKKYNLHIVDRVGGGDSFGAGLIYSQIKGYNLQESIEFAVAASCLKHSIEGDFNLATVDEVKALAGGDGSGRVLR